MTGTDRRRDRPMTNAPTTPGPSDPVWPDLYAPERWRRVNGDPALPRPAEGGSAWPSS